MEYTNGGVPRPPGRSAFARALRDAINARPVTLSWLQRQLKARGNRVSMATLSYWRSGSRRPEGPQSLAALADIEDLLGLEDAALSRLLRPNRTGPLGVSGFPIDHREIEQAVIDAYTAMGSPYPDTSRELTTHSVTDVDERGNVSFCSTRSIVQSTTGTIHAIPFLEIMPGLPSPAPILRAVSGGRFTRHYSHPGGEVHGALFELDVQIGGACDRTHRSRTNSIFLGRFPCCFNDLRMICQTKIIVRAKIEHILSIHDQPCALRRANRADAVV